MPRSLAAVVLATALVACGSSDPRPRPAVQRARTTDAPPGRLLAQSPYMGVACPTPNSIACDRVGLAVWLKRPAAHVSASIEGQALVMHAGGFGGRGPTYWEGYLQPAGLVGGPLRVIPDRGSDFWQGSHPKDARVALAVEGRDGVTRRTSLRLGLHAGWG